MRRGKIAISGKAIPVDYSILVKEKKNEKKRNYLRE